MYWTVELLRFVSKRQTFCRGGLTTNQFLFRNSSSCAITSTYKEGLIVMIIFFIQLLSDWEVGMSVSAGPLNLDSTWFSRVMISGYDRKKTDRKPQNTKDWADDTLFFKWKEADFTQRKYAYMSKSNWITERYKDLSLHIFGF